MIFFFSKEKHFLQDALNSDFQNYISKQYVVRFLIRPIFTSFCCLYIAFCYERQNRKSKFTVGPGGNYPLTNEQKNVSNRDHSTTSEFFSCEPCFEQKSTRLIFGRRRYCWLVCTFSVCVNSPIHTRGTQNHTNIIIDDWCANATGDSSEIACRLNIAPSWGRISGPSNNASSISDLFEVNSSKYRPPILG